MLREFSGDIAMKLFGGMIGCMVGEVGETEQGPCSQGSGNPSPYYILLPQGREQKPRSPYPFLAVYAFVHAGTGLSFAAKVSIGAETDMGQHPNLGGISREEFGRCSLWQGYAFKIDLSRFVPSVSGLEAVRCGSLTKS